MKSPAITNSQPVLDALEPEAIRAAQIASVSMLMGCIASLHVALVQEEARQGRIDVNTSKIEANITQAYQALMVIAEDLFGLDCSDICKVIIEEVNEHFEDSGVRIGLEAIDPDTGRLSKSKIEEMFASLDTEKEGN